VEEVSPAHRSVTDFGLWRHTEIRFAENQRQLPSIDSPQQRQIRPSDIAFRPMLRTPVSFLKLHVKLLKQS